MQKRLALGFHRVLLVVVGFLVWCLGLRVLGMGLAFGVCGSEATEVNLDEGPMLTEFWTIP